MQRSFQLFKQKQCLLMSLTLFGLFFVGGCDKKPVADGPKKASPIDVPILPEGTEDPLLKSNMEFVTVEGHSPEWVSLFDGKTLEGWDSIEFGGEGDIEVRDGAISVGAGDPLTGFYSTRDDIPKTNYEVTLSARKLEGIDFFCGLTFRLPSRIVL